MFILLNEVYVGKIVDYISSVFLVSVIIIVMNIRMGNQMIVYMNVNGDYYLVLSLFLDYIVWYLKLGFCEVEFDVNIQDGFDCIIFGVIFLLLVMVVFSINGGGNLGFV